MAPATLDSGEYERMRDELAVGTLDFGNGLHISWDLRDLLTQSRRQEKMKDSFVVNGRLLMPSLGII